MKYSVQSANAFTKDRQCDLKYRANDMLLIIGAREMGTLLINKAGSKWRGPGKSQESNSNASWPLVTRFGRGGELLLPPTAHNAC